VRFLFGPGGEIQVLWAARRRRCQRAPQPVDPERLAAVARLALEGSVVRVVGVDRAVAEVAYEQAIGEAAE
jgi:hypothetical protein